MPERYRTILADPPWTMPRGGQQSRGTRGDSTHSRWWNAATTRPMDLPYSTMTLDAIKALPVTSVVEDNAHLYLWVPNAFLEASYDVARAWGFKPSQMLVWAKTPRGMGLGGAFVNTTEFLLFARRGSLAPLARQTTTWWNFKRPFDGSKPAHSRKPEGFFEIVEQVSPGPYLELFARRRRLGWDAWGNEVDSDVEMAA